MWSTCHEHGTKKKNTELRRTRGELGHIQGSCMTCVLCTAWISNVEIVMCVICKERRQLLSSVKKWEMMWSTCHQHGTKKLSRSPTGMELMTFLTPVGCSNHCSYEIIRFIYDYCIKFIIFFSTRQTPLHKSSLPNTRFGVLSQVNNDKKVENTTRSQVFLVNFKSFHTVTKHCFKCLI